MADAPAALLLVHGAYGPYLHSAQRLDAEHVVDLPAGLNAAYELWVLEAGRVRLEHQDKRVGDLRAPALLCFAPEERPAIAGAPVGYRLIFDAVHQARRRRPGSAAFLHEDASVQPAPERIWGCRLPERAETRHHAGALAMARACESCWWRGALGYARANHLLGGWLLDWVATLGGEVLAADVAWHERIVSLLEGRLHRCRSVADWAALIGMSRTGFARRFSSASGRSPGSVLRGLRHELACRLLREGSPIEDVATRCGHPSAAAFSHHFRACAGLAPRAWRALEAERGRA